MTLFFYNKLSCHLFYFHPRQVTKKQPFKKYISFKQSRLPAPAPPGFLPLTPGIYRYFRGFPGVPAQGVPNRYPMNTEGVGANLKRNQYPLQPHFKLKIPPAAKAVLHNKQLKATNLTKKTTKIKASHEMNNPFGCLIPKYVPSPRSLHNLPADQEQRQFCNLRIVQCRYFAVDGIYITALKFTKFDTCQFAQFVF